MTKEQLKTAIASAMEQYGYVGRPYEWLRLTLRGCETLEEAVDFCTDENFHSLASALEEAAEVATPIGTDPAPPVVRERSVSKRRWWQIPRLRFWAR